jgi:uncharacterized protein
MNYRKIGKNNLRVSTFGVGCMRLPLTVHEDGSTDYGDINEPEAIRMIRYAVDHGVTYIDTAYPYHQGNSELVVGKALSDGYREKVLLATKLPVWKAKKPEDFDTLLNEQLEKLQTDHIDFYLLHALGEDTWEKVKNMGVLDFLDRVKTSGKIKHAAFSFHDELPVFKKIIDSYDWDMCQIQLNLLDEHYQAGLEGMHYAADRGISVVIMEPLRGGALAQKVPSDIKAVWDESAVKRSPAEWAFRWLANFPQISVILSGVSTMDQLKDNLRIFSDIQPDSLTDEEKSLIKRVQSLYQKKIKVACTGCNYCMPCPSGVAIPDVFRLYNQAFLYDDLENSKKRYAALMEKEKDASRCVECGQCEPQCPQNIPIIQKLAEAHEILSR